MTTQLHPPRLPLTLSWREAPLRTIRATGSRPRLPAVDPPAWVHSGTPGRPFDFSGLMRALLADIARRCPPLSHIDSDRLLVGVLQARSGRSGGLQARVTPLRCRDGKLRRVRRGVVYQVQRYLIAGHEYLYLMAFCLPRFLDRDFDDKLITLFHELYHIGPNCDGDLRRHHGRCSVHSRSKKKYDTHMAHLAREYLATKPDESLYGFLRLDFGQLVQRHGSVLGVCVPRPRLIPCGEGHRTNEQGHNSK